MREWTNSAECFDAGVVTKSNLEESEGLEQTKHPTIRKAACKSCSIPAVGTPSSKRSGGRPHE